MRVGSPLTNSTRHVVQRAFPPHACRMSTPASCSIALTRRLPSSTSTVANPSTVSLGMRAMLTYRVDMPDVPEIPRPSQLWKRLSSERKLLAADAFWQDENAAAEQAEAMVLIAQRIKFRTQQRANAAAGEEGASPRDAGCGLRDGCGAAARRVSPASSARDDGRLSRCAGHHPRGRPDRRRGREAAVRRTPARRGPGDRRDPIPPRTSRSTCRP